VNDGWQGVGVTLSPADGGLAMQFSHPRLEVKYADVGDEASFIATAAACGLRCADLVNMGIVLDAVVKRGRSEAKQAVGFKEQLRTQLLAAMQCLRDDGRGVLMGALKIDFPSLPEVIPTLLLLQRSCARLRVIPTMYTAECGKKQLYFVACGVTGLGDGLVKDVFSLWENGKKRYNALRTYAVNRKRQRDTEDQKVDLNEATDIAAAYMGLYDSVATVSELYGAGGVGKDLDEFFGMVACALSRKHSVAPAC
jgi:hypothetical protein